MMDYQQAEAYLFSKLPMYQNIGSQALKPGLQNIRLLLEELGNPQESIRMVHIAGTNGKGSVCHILSALLQQHNWRIGLYSSPHYKSYRERIKINANHIEEDVIVEYVEKLKPLIEEHHFSFFEITVAMAFMYFAEKKVDLAIIETGLGGRLDSTNIISPLICGITNIGMDHTDVLGETIEQIAAEKAGIIKDFVPVIIGEKQKALNTIFKKKAKEHNAPLVYADQLVEVQSTDNGMVDISLQGDQMTVAYDLKGSYQLNNLKTALAIYRVICLELDEPMQKPDSIQNALGNIRSLTAFMGRFHLLPGSPPVLLDSAHNPEGFELLNKDLDKMTYEQLHVVLGVSKGKDIKACLSFLPNDAKYYISAASVPRALPTDELSEAMQQIGFQYGAFQNLMKALEAAKSSSKSKDLILVVGSVFTVAEILQEVPDSALFTTTQSGMTV